MARITSSGGEVGRLNTGGGAEVRFILTVILFNPRWLDFAYGLKTPLSKKKFISASIWISDASSDTIFFCTWLLVSWTFSEIKKCTKTTVQWRVKMQVYFGLQIYGGWYPMILANLFDR